MKEKNWDYSKVTEDKIAKIKKNRCYTNHPKDKKRTLKDFYFVCSKDGIDYYSCIQCRAINNYEIDRLERIIENEKKQKEYSMELMNKRIEEKRVRINRDLWDYVVQQELNKKSIVSLKYPKKLVQLKRASMKLTRILKALSHLPGYNNAVIVNIGCNKHGLLKDNYKIKINSMLDRGSWFKCRLCLNEILQIFYSSKTIKERNELIKKFIKDDFNQNGDYGK